MARSRMFHFPNISIVEADIKVNVNLDRFEKQFQDAQLWLDEQVWTGTKKYIPQRDGMPENLLRKIVSEESGKGTGMIKLVVNLDSRTVLEQLINTAKEMQMSNGQNVFELGR